MAGGGSFLGLLAMTAGIWLVDSAVQNRPPIKVLLDVIKSPGSALSTVKSANGTAYALPTHSPVTASAGSASYGGVSASTPQAATAISFARAQIGKPYAYGKTGPSSYDCSGLVQAAYKSAGVTLPRTTKGQILVGTPVSKANLQPGDLVFPDLGHVQIYTGNGRVVEAPHTGTKVREVPMWGFLTARRIVYTAPVNV